MSFSYDKRINGKHKDLFPFFVKKTGVHSMCDYILFCEYDSKLFILLIELKRGHDEVMTQLNAGKCFAQFIISTFNRIENYQLKPEIRLISIRNIHIVKKGPIQCKDVRYDKNNFYTFEGNTFFIKQFLH